MQNREHFDRPVFEHIINGVGKSSKQYATRFAMLERI